MALPNAPVLPSGWDCHVHVFEAGGSSPALEAPKHYAPVHHPLERIEALAAEHGFGHLVLVQPSVYGADNSLMLAALDKERGRHRGVVVVDAAVPDAELQRWHALGVRGIRCNLVSPVGNHHTDWAIWAPRLRELGWHVQWYAHGDQLHEIARWQQSYRLPCVLDHVAGMHTRFAQNALAWQSLRELAQAGAWIKLSGWYRLGLNPPYGAPYDLAPLQLNQIHALFKDRSVWGSDWPHTSFVYEQMPTYSQVWQPLQGALGDEAANKLSTHAVQLYGA
jgi:predicted TIM-barrel fold metal-dependent hydrolase